MTRTFPILLLSVFPFLFLSACAGDVSRTAGFAAGDHRLDLPIGVGPDSNELKKSPCACLEIELLPPAASRQG